MQINHPELVDLLKTAYSAEKAAAFAYQGHAEAVKNSEEKTAIHQIELDEWNHREEVLQIMKQYNIPISKYYEFRLLQLKEIVHNAKAETGLKRPLIWADLKPN